jgi:hypothetical protein
MRANSLLVVDPDEESMLSVRYLGIVSWLHEQSGKSSPGTTPALRLGPGAEEPDPVLLLDEEPFPDEPSLLGAAGPVAGVAGVALGRDMVVCGRCCFLSIA